MIGWTIWKKCSVPVDWVEDALESGKQTRDRETSSEVITVNLGKN